MQMGGWIGEQPESMPLIRARNLTSRIYNPPQQEHCCRAVTFEQWERITGEPGGVDYIETDAGRVPAMWAAPKNCAQDRALLCAHGGGYVAGSMYTSQDLRPCGKGTGCRALIVYYGRAPENVHPGPVNDMVGSYKWLLDQSIRPDHVALIGDSAGGGLAVTTILRARKS